MPICCVSRFMGGMAHHVVPVALQRIAVALRALAAVAKRGRSPLPGTAALIQSKFLTRNASSAFQRKQQKQFRFR